jgi:hypothetical protein
MTSYKDFLKAQESNINQKLKPFTAKPQGT